MQPRETWWAVKEQGTGFLQFSLYQHNQIQPGFSSHLLASAPSAAVSSLCSTVCPVPQYLWSCIGWHLKFGPGLIKYRRAMDGEAPLKNKGTNGFVTSCLRAARSPVSLHFFWQKLNTSVFLILHTNQSYYRCTTTSSGNEWLAGVTYL